MIHTGKLWKITVLASLLSLFGGWGTQEIKAQEIILDFTDGLLPSAKGWTFIGQDQFQQPLSESHAASVSGGILHLNTVPFGGVGSNDTLAYWRISTASIDPANYEYEIRMRAIAPNSFRSCFGGLLGAGIEVRGSYDSDITVTQPNLYLSGFSPTPSNAPCFLFSLDGSIFHTYKLVVQNDTQATLFVDGVQIAQGVLTRPNTLTLEAVFGDISTSGGNVTADIEFVRIASLATTVAIDINPGSFPNSVNPRNNGVVPVAILTTAAFDATTVNPMSVKFGPNGATEAHGRGHLEDVDGDGDLDLVLHFRTQAAGIVCGATSASLTGQTFGGQSISGTDSVRTVGCR